MRYQIGNRVRFRKEFKNAGTEWTVKDIRPHVMNGTRVLMLKGFNHNVDGVRLGLHPDMFELVSHLDEDLFIV